mmetsp:Transcript_27992/g.82317  ORF Transcript_27992/g.82317 Transcript_27992/m.82317 type:complete len:147 (+) Transcript_27992:461-901(+)
MKQCIATNYSKTTAKTIFELPLAALLSDHKGQKKFEASDITIVDDSAYVVCDSSWAITKLKLPLQPFSKDNFQIGNPSRVATEVRAVEFITQLMRPEAFCDFFLHKMEYTRSPHFLQMFCHTTGQRNLTTRPSFTMVTLFMLLENQ